LKRKAVMLNSTTVEPICMLIRKYKDLFYR